MLNQVFVFFLCELIVSGNAMGIQQTSFRDASNTAATVIGDLPPPDYAGILGSECVSAVIGKYNCLAAPLEYGRERVEELLRELDGDTATSWLEECKQSMPCDEFGFERLNKSSVELFPESGLYFEKLPASMNLSLPDPEPLPRPEIKPMPRDWKEEPMPEPEQGSISNLRATLQKQCPACNCDGQKDDGPKSREDKSGEMKGLQEGFTKGEMAQGFRQEFLGKHDKCMQMKGDARGMQTCEGLPTPPCAFEQEEGIQKVVEEFANKHVDGDETTCLPTRMCFMQKLHVAIAKLKSSEDFKRGLESSKNQCQQSDTVEISKECLLNVARASCECRQTNNYRSAAAEVCGMKLNKKSEEEKGCDDAANIDMKLLMTAMKPKGEKPMGEMAVGRPIDYDYEGDMSAGGMFGGEGDMSAGGMFGGEGAVRHDENREIESDNFSQQSNNGPQMQRPNFVTTIQATMAPTSPPVINSFVDGAETASDRLATFAAGNAASAVDAARNAQTQMMNKIREMMN